MPCDTCNLAASQGPAIASDSTTLHSKKIPRQQIGGAVKQHLAHLLLASAMALLALSIMVKQQDIHLDIHLAHASLVTTATE